MSFVTNLAKGFVRSAVNQVGRDGGKVISNRIYKGNHATPIRIVSSDNSTVNGNELVEISDHVFVRIFLSLLVCLILPFLGSIIYLYWGLLFCFKKKYTLYRVETEPVYVLDRRYKDGKRFEGNRNVNIPVEVQATKYEIKRMRIKGFIYLFFSIASATLYIYLFFINPL